MVGEARTKELVFRGNQIDAERAADSGIINRAVEPVGFDELVADFVGDMLEGPPLAFKVAKNVMNQGKYASMEAALSLESQGFGHLMSTEDTKEGTAAYLEDRDAEFKEE